MAMAINAGDDAVRKEFYYVNPYEIVVQEELRGRAFPPTIAQIMAMAISLYQHGQRQPVECRRLPNNKLQLVLGFTRTSAARMLREGFTDEEGTHWHDPDMKLKTTVSQTNEQEAFIHNIVENLHRNDLSPIDDARNQERLRDRNGFTDVAIAKLYGYKNSVKVGRLKKLLLLTMEEQLLVHERKLSVENAIDLLLIEDAQKRAEIIANALKENGKVDRTEVQDAIRDQIFGDRVIADPDAEHIIEESNSEGKPSKKPTNVSKPKTGKSSANKAPALGVAGIRKFWFKLQQTHENEKVKKFSDVFIDWISSRKSDKAMRKALEDLIS